MKHRPIMARIDRAALAHNLGRVRAFAPQSKTLAVIKANAYGHGLMRAAQALSNSDGFALLDLEDAIVLRQAGFGQTIVLLEGFFSARELPLIIENRVSVVVHSVEQIRMLELFRGPGKINAFVKANTGMNRLGFSPEMLMQAVERLERLAIVEISGLVTHFATADEKPGLGTQFQRFMQYASKRYPWSVANSAALIRYPQTRTDWVRPGIMLYGASPFFDESASDLGLLPVMTLSSSVIAIQEVKAGEAVGYGANFCAERALRIGIIACGYADGYPRHAPTGTPILVSGRRTRTVGRVSMDMLFADLTDIPDANVGSPVTLWGQGLPVEEVAGASGTISYELLCALAPRVPITEI